MRRTLVIGDVLNEENQFLDGETYLADWSAVRVKIVGTFYGTVNFEASYDGKEWSPYSLFETLSGYGSSHIVKPGVYFAALDRFYFRVATSNWYSGSVLVEIIYYAKRG